MAKIKKTNIRSLPDSSQNFDSLLPQNEKEKLLEQQLTTAQQTLASLKAKVKDLREENDFLNKEAERIKNDTEEYNKYIEEATEKQQMKAVELFDEYYSKIKEAKAKKEEIIQSHEEQKSELKRTLIEKESILAQMKLLLADLEPYQQLEESQTARIKQLENEIEEMKQRSFTVMEKLKKELLSTKKTSEVTQKKEILRITKDITENACLSLKNYMAEIVEKNSALRRRLTELLNKNITLQEKKAKLDEKYKQLTIEHQYREDLKEMGLWSCRLK
ncbi:myosin heavy chain, skeletal muscle-like [Limulus polyphemus]|uniref:Myosin heavy chain, skeletal muscle-like n=1 Tax=Limulus polyphemus TaxID=6850 RepID=A0ABM1BPC9_LIMPO|nr:myosin heavy chain, skeletal muscle-like [Limulus polyphemus]